MLRVFDKFNFRLQFSKCLVQGRSSMKAIDEKTRCTCVEHPGTHRGHINLFSSVPRTPSSASVCLQFVRVPFSHSTFTAVTRGQIPSGTPNLSRDRKSVV